MNPNKKPQQSFNSRGGSTHGIALPVITAPRSARDIELTIPTHQRAARNSSAPPRRNDYAMEIDQVDNLADNPEADFQRQFDQIKRERDEMARELDTIKLALSRERVTGEELTKKPASFEALSAAQQASPSTAHDATPDLEASEELDVKYHPSELEMAHGMPQPGDHAAVTQEASGELVQVKPEPQVKLEHE
ncbi:hypothetical protein BDV95DRAFT_574850 [Massariosphaeria phaeospora]|uniref:Uncharacterized protein n=1 Tax=Massariosphaeria phaeospora TaxID=100035 RepID=A0A7C8MB24_9PLEO|nr:hypothetical protein BDV95DRAFT_574850 [Massariosphaeria phaeospora]